MKSWKSAVLTALCSMTMLLVQAQDWSSLKIDEYYSHERLDVVLNDLEAKYGLDFDFDSTLVKNYRFSYLFGGVKAELAVEILFRKFEAIDYEIDNNGVIHVRKAAEISPKISTTNERYFGNPKAFNIKVSGGIVDQMSGESLPFATISVLGTNNGTSTNVDGYFTLFDVPTDTSTLVISYVGYEQATFHLSPILAKKALKVEIAQSMSKLKEFEVVGEREELLRTGDEVSMVSISPAQMATLPSLGEKDIFRAFQLLPGVSGSNESSAGLFVRGGTPDQNLILYDGFTVYHVDHLFGMFSAFNANAVKDVKLYKGGFESKYGGRLSSVMEIVGKEGNSKEFNMGADFSFLSMNGFIEAPIGEKANFFIAARRSWKSPLYTSLFESFNTESETATPAPAAPAGRGNRQMESADPKSYFYDLNARFTYRPTDKDILTYSFFNGQDDLDNSRLINRTRGETTISGGTTDLTKWGNWGSSAKWSRKWGDQFYSNVMASYSNYYSLRDRSVTRSVTNNGETNEFSRGSNEDNDLRDFTFKIDNEWKTGKKNEIEFGTQVTNYDIDYDYIQNDTTIIQQRRDNGQLYSLYLQDTWKPFKGASINVGARESFYSPTEEFYFEPRANASLKLGKRFKLKGAWGHYYQYANRVVREDILTGSRDFWVLADDETVPVGFAEHYIAGVSYETKDFIFDVEAYHKNLTGLSEYTLRFAPSFGTINYEELFYEGDGYARGIEFLLQKKYGKYTGWFGYTLGEVMYDFPVYSDDPFPASHDVTNEFKFVNSFKWRKWTFASTFVYATGKPYTEPLGGYQVTLIDGSTADFISVGSKNGTRYPDYHRMDLAATYEFKMGEKSKGQMSFSLFNVYNHKNIWYKEFEVDEDQLIETDVNLLGITPNITLSLKLR